MQLTNTKYGIVLTDQNGNTFHYIKSSQEGKLVRCEATVNNQYFGNQGLNKYWSKAGRGMTKKTAKELLIKADSYMAEMGYTFK
jgi:hypothetical protein